MKPIAGIYARVSLEDKQKGGEKYSIDSQVRLGLEHAEKDGFRVPKELIFIDDGCLGGEADRPDFMRMRDAVRERRMGMERLYTLDLDRMCRDVALLCHVMTDFEKSEVGLKLVLGGLVEQTPQGRMMAQMRGVFAEFEKHQIRERTSRGRKEKALQGHVNSGRVAYGYRYHGKAYSKKGELVIHDQEAEIVRRIFDLADAGWTLLQIARALNNDGVPCARRAKQWSKPVVRGILRNSVYRGEATYNKRRAAEPIKRRTPPKPGKSKTTSQRLRAESEWIRVPVPAIIRREQFERVQQRMERNRALHAGRPSKQHLLRGLLKCGVCGHSFCIFYSGGKPMYRCNNFDADRKRQCDTRITLNAAALEAEVLRRVHAACTEPEACAAEAAKISREASRSNRNVGKQRQQLQETITRLRQKKARLVESFSDEELSFARENFRQQLKDNEAKLREAERSLEALAPQPERPARIAAAADIRKWYHALIETNPRAVVSRIVRRIDIQADGTVVIDIGIPAVIEAADFDPSSNGINRIHKQHDACPSPFAAARGRHPAFSRRRP